MKNGFMLIAGLLSVILIFVLIQFYLTRRTMVEFAGQHGVTYTNARWNPFAIGTLQGAVDHAGFFMGCMSTKFSFGPMSGAQYPDEKSIFMRLAVTNMPLNMVIRRRGRGVQGDAVESVLAATGYSVVKTRDDDFDARFDVIGSENEVLAWLTDQRRNTLKTFLSRKNCAVADGSLKIEFTSTFIGRDDIESAFTHIREAQLLLSHESFEHTTVLQDG
jgi:hypothetical protein